MAVGPTWPRTRPLVMCEQVIFISGCHSDADPSPGLGIARSLRSAFPNVRLIGVDYSAGCSGLHAAEFDQVRVQPGWSAIDLETYACQISDVLREQQTCWISGLDVETDWLATAVGVHSRLLIPSAEAQRVTRKPQLAAAERLRMRVPPTIPTDASPVELHRFGRHAGSHIWVKGACHDAYAASSFPELGLQIERMRQFWPLE